MVICKGCPFYGDYRDRLLEVVRVIRLKVLRVRYLQRGRGVSWDWESLRRRCQLLKVRKERIDYLVCISGIYGFFGFVYPSSIGPPTVGGPSFRRVYGS